MQNTTDMHYMLLGNVFLYCITAVLGGVGIILLCQWFPSSKQSLLGYLGVNSLIIMLTHLDFRIINIAIQLAKRILNLLTIENSWLFYGLMALIITVLELICIWVINHFFYFLLGQKKQVKS
jgi:hypothetical protein